jgi:hypothetical protein
MHHMTRRSTSLRRRIHACRMRRRIMHHTTGRSTSLRRRIHACRMRRRIHAPHDTAINKSEEEDTCMSYEEEDNAPHHRAINI